MSVLGWIFLATSLSFVWGLTGWCYYKILSSPAGPPEELKHFHSA
jgi:hypothetical protein